MRSRLLKCLAITAILGISAGSLRADDPKREYFTNVREVRVTQPDHTNYLVVDPEIWMHARGDLGDLRLYGSGDVPYAFRVMGTAEFIQQRPLKILNRGIYHGNPQFMLDMSGVDVYDEIVLQVNQRDFDRLVTVQGANASDAEEWVTIATTPIYDFTQHKLGSNFVIPVPQSNFHYLLLTITGEGWDRGNEIRPEQLQGATARNTLRANAVWDSVTPLAVTAETKKQKTVISFDLPKAVPIGRIQFVVPPEKIDFRRPLTIETRTERGGVPEEEAWQTIADGELARVRSAGDKIHEDLEISTHDLRAEHWRITISNGDDPPLPVRLIPQMIERRLYFAPHGTTTLKLYYGDDNVIAPVYDYDKFFRDADAKTAVVAELGAGMHNPQYKPRPDQRPWSERNGWVLWVAMAVAIIGIGLIALRGLKKA
jgi:Protein of unknown function (DUF3999)